MIPRNHTLAGIQFRDATVVQKDGVVILNKYNSIKSTPCFSNHIDATSYTLNSYVVVILSIET